MQKVGFFTIVFIMILLNGCVTQSGNVDAKYDYEESFNKMILETTIDFSANENWRTIYPYIENLGKSVSEFAEDYMDWQSTGWAVGSSGVSFRNLNTDVIYVFAPEEFGKLESESPDNLNLVLKGNEILIGVGAEISYFFRNFISMNSKEESITFLEEDLGINRFLFVNTVDTELDGNYMAILLGNRLLLDIYCLNWEIRLDSWFEVTLLSDSNYEFQRRLMMREYNESGGRM